MKRILMFLFVSTMLIAVTSLAYAEQPQEKGKDCQYSGILKEKVNDPSRTIIVTVEGNSMQFLFEESSKKPCKTWDELNPNDNITVECKAKREGLIARCITINPQPASGTSIQGGTMHGVTIK